MVFGRTLVREGTTSAKDTTDYTPAPIVTYLDSVVVTPVSGHLLTITDYEGYNQMNDNGPLTEVHDTTPRWSDETISIAE